MFQQDLILRLIQQVGDAIARALRLKKDGQCEHALQELNAAKRHLRLVPGLAAHATPETLYQLLGAEQTRALARLLKTESEILLTLGRDTQAHHAQKRSRQLLLLCNSAPTEEATVP